MSQRDSYAVICFFHNLVVSVFDHAVRHQGRSPATTKLGTRPLSVIERARAHLVLSKKRGSNALFCNEVRLLRPSHVHSIAASHMVSLQLKTLHLIAGLRMSWEARSMHVIVAKISSKKCALDQKSP